MPRVLCTALATQTGPHFPLLQEAGFEVDAVPIDQSVYEPAALLKWVKGYDAIIAGSEPWPRSVIEAVPEVRVLSRTGVGFDAIDMAACDDHGVIVATTPGVNHHAVAEHTMALLFGCGRGFPKRDAVVRSGTWERFSTPRIMGQTLGIVGLGRIGRAVATRAAGVGMKLLAYDPHPPTEFADQWNVTFCTLDELLSQSDYVSLHLPVMPETKNIINARTLGLMKKGSILINTARGALVDEVALEAALKSGHLRAAGLDVMQVEPLPLSSPLLKLDNVLTSGHVAGLDNESQHDTLVMCADTIIQLHRGQWPTERIRNLAGVKNWTWTR